MTNFLGGLRRRWKSPPRSGARLIVSPWEYRNLRTWVGVRIISGVVLVALGLVTLIFGGNNWKTYWWTIAFVVLAAANWAFSYWLLRIARSEASED